jgi:hypothetical protein
MQVIYKLFNYFNKYLNNSVNSCISGNLEILT